MGHRLASGAGAPGLLCLSLQVLGLGRVCGRGRARLGCRRVRQLCLCAQIGERHTLQGLTSGRPFSAVSVGEGHLSGEARLAIEALNNEKG